MTLKTLPWDAADSLTDERAIAGYLDAALEDGDPELIAAALGDIARAKGIDDLAARVGLSLDELSLLFSGETASDFAKIMTIIDALGLQLVARTKATATNS